MGSSCESQIWKSKGHDEKKNWRERNDEFHLGKTQKWSGRMGMQRVTVAQEPGLLGNQRQSPGGSVWP